MHKLKTVFNSFGIFVFLFFAPLNGQGLNHFLFNNYSVNEGLSQNGVNCFARDSSGFMWIGTNGGLNRFDGFEFKNYYHEPNDSTSISGSIIYSIVVDETNRLWIGTDQGLSIYNPTNNSFQQFVLVDSITSEIKYIFQENETDLWVSDENSGLYRIKNYKEKEKEIKYFEFDKEHGQVNTLFSSNTHKKNKLWIGANEGLYLLNKITGELSDFYKNRQISLVQHPFKVSTINEDHRGNLFVTGYPIRGNQPTLYYYHPDKDALIPIIIRNSDSKVFLWPTNKFQFDSKNNIWASLPGRGLAFLKLKKDFEYESPSFISQSVNSNSLLSNMINSLYLDRQNILWIGSFLGFSKVQIGDNGFKYQPHNISKNQKFASNSTRAVLKDSKGRLWHGGYSGLFLKDTSGWQHFSQRLPNSHGMRGNHVRVIYEDPNYNGNVFWIGMEDKGLNRFDVQKKSFTNFSNQINVLNSLGSNLITSILRDSKGELWVATFEAGLFKMKEKNGTFERYYNNKNIPNSLNSNFINILYEDSNNNFWIGTANDGLKLLNRLTNQFSHFRKNNKKNGLPNNNILSILESNFDPNLLWVGTKGGLSFFYKDSLPDIGFKTFTRQDGLPDDVIYGILEDEEGNLWLSTNKGIASFNPKTKRTRVFDFNDGLQDNEFNTGAYFKSENGEMFFGGINGITHFFPKDIKINENLPQLAITRFKKFNTEVETDTNIVYKRIIELDYDENMISFDIAALEFSAPDMNQYAYKLDGFNTEWILSGKQREISFTNLDPGKYTLRYKASNNDGVWNENSSTLRIIVNPPFWLTWWFRLASIATTIGLLILLYTNRTKSIRRHNTALEAEIKEREQAEVALSKSEKKFRTLFETAGDAIFIIKDAKIIDCNSKTLDMFKCTYQQMLSLSPMEISPEFQPDGQQSNTVILQNMEKVLSGENIVLEWKHQKFDKTVFDADVSLGMVNLQDEIYIQAIVRDITSRKKTEAALIESENKYRTLIKTANDAIFIIKDRSIVECNSKSLELFKSPLEYILNKKVEEFSPEFQPDGVSSKEKAQIKLTAALKGDPQVFEWKHIRHDNTSFDAEISLNRFQKEDGQVFVMSISRDISDRKAAEDALRRSEERYKRIIEDQTEFIVRWKPDGIRTFVNNSYCDYYGVTAEETIGTSFFPFISEKDRELVIRRLESLSPENPVTSGEHEVLRKDGSKGWNHWIDRAFYDEEGKVIEYQSVGRDITVEKEAETALQKRLELENFITSISTKLINLKASDVMAELNNSLNKVGHIINVERCFLYILDKELMLADYAFEWNAPGVKSISEKRVIEKTEDFPFLMDNLMQGKTVVCNSISEMPEIAKNEKDYMIEHNIKSFLHTPLFFENRPIGLLGFDRESDSHEWNEWDIQVVKQVANIFSSALQYKVVNEALTKSEEKFSKAFHSSPDAVTISSIEDRVFLDVNEGFTKITGYSRDEAIGQITSSFWANSEERNEMLKQLEQKGHIKDFECNIKRKPGKIIPAEISAEPIEFEGKKCLIAITRDISEHKKNIEKIGRSENKLRELTRHLQKIREEERSAIAREMHDELGQILTALKMDIIILEKGIEAKKENIEVNQILKETDDMKVLIDTTINNVRKLIKELRPEVLDNLGLIEALKWLVSEFKGKTGIEASFNSSINQIELEKDHNIAIFRIVQESLTNVIRHAKATEAIVNMKMEEKYLVLTISDNGIGFNPNQPKENRFGLMGIKERAFLFNGDITIESSPGDGTTVTLQVPLKA